MDDTQELIDALIDAGGDWVTVKGRSTGREYQLSLTNPFLGSTDVALLTPEGHRISPVNPSLYVLAEKEPEEEDLSTTVDKYLIVREDEEGPVICTRVTAKPEHHDQIIREEIERLAHKYPGHRISAYADMPKHTARANLMWGGQ